MPLEARHLERLAAHGLLVMELPANDGQVSRYKVCKARPDGVHESGSGGVWVGEPPVTPAGVAQLSSPPALVTRMRELYGAEAVMFAVDGDAIWLFERPWSWTVQDLPYGGPPSFRWEVASADEAVELAARLSARPHGTAAEQYMPTGGGH